MVTFVVLVVTNILLPACRAADPAGDRLKGMKAAEFYSTPLQKEFAEAAAKDDMGRVDLLLKQGADINALGKNNMTPLMWVMLKKNKSAFRHLLERGANPNVQLDTGQSVISYSAMAVDPEYLKLVLSHGGNPNLVDSRKGITPVFESIHRDDAENLRRLIAAGANLDFRGPGGDTPAIETAILAQYEMLFYLIEAGADPTLKDRPKWGGSAIDYLVKDHIDPKSKANEWRNKVLELLKSKGVPLR